MDALSVMFDGVLGDAGKASWRKNCPQKRMRYADDRLSSRGPAAAFGLSLTFREDVVTANSSQKEDNLPLDTISRVEDEDATDELSFLVNKCDLDAERKQSMFMPYIT